MSLYSIQVVLDLFLPSAYFEVSQECPTHPYWPCSSFAHLSVIWNGPILCFEETVLEDQLDVPGAANCLPCDPARQTSNKLKFALRQSRLAILLFVLLIYLRIFSYTVSGLQPKLPSTSTPPASLFMSNRSSTAPPLADSPVTCLKKLSVDFLHLNHASSADVYGTWCSLE